MDGVDGCLYAAGAVDVAEVHEVVVVVFEGVEHDFACHLLQGRAHNVHKVDVYPQVANSRPRPLMLHKYKFADANKIMNMS